MGLSSPTGTAQYKVSISGLSKLKKQVVGRARNPLWHLWLQHTSRIYHIPLPFVSKFFSPTYCMNLILRDSSDIICNINDIRLSEDQNMSATHRVALAGRKWHAGRVWQVCSTEETRTAGQPTTLWPYLSVWRALLQDLPKVMPVHLLQSQS